MLLLTRTDLTPYWRTLLILGRVSNLPTVWSNCLAGWLLGGGGTGWIFLVLCLGTSCLFLGGMFLNDAFDVEFDRQYRQERPIPSGAITLDEVWRWGFGWLGAGTAILIPLQIARPVTPRAAYISGLSFLARQESTGGALNYWPSCLLAAPIALALLVNAEEYRQAALLLSAILGLWIVRCLRHAFLVSDPNVGRAVGGPLAGARS